MCLAAIFQEPCKSRSNPSASYNDSKYYEPIFNGNQKQMARICKELLYIDDYFVKNFLPKFEWDNKDSPETIPFARLANRSTSLYTDSYDEALDKLFEAIIVEGVTAYSYARDNNPTLTETNFLKSDKNYYDILKRRRLNLRREIAKIFS